MEAARKLADDGERKVILGALEKIKAGQVTLVCVRRERCPRSRLLPLSPPRRFPLRDATRSVSPSYIHTHAHAHTHARPAAAPPARRRTPRSLEENKIGDAGAVALAKALATSQLTTLEYVRAPLPPPHHCLLGDATRSLSPSHTHTHTHTRPPAAPPARCRAPRSLFSNKIGDDGAAALAKALATSQLTGL